jgi:hypothetical protein
MARARVKYQMFNLQDMSIDSPSETPICPIMISVFWYSTLKIMIHAIENHWYVDLVKLKRRYHQYHVVVSSDKVDKHPTDGIPRRQQLQVVG